MILPFVREGRTGSVAVTVERVDDPAAIGQTVEARDFPCLTARVTYPEHGYGAMFGWVQMVRSTDGAAGGDAFGMDPFVLFPDSRSPYCYFGLNPTLFDSPARLDREPMSWLAHTFLAWTPIAETIERHVVPLVGFDWGFDVDATGDVAIRDAAPLPDSAWTDHLPFLVARHPTWTFARRPTPEADSE
ncbi:hypothetical protein [Embleya hyalina]|uniref:Uncharacterized protein n=1 Tax=Embleya hyalina TaxID=516124 RepID=A0A401YXJ2_9ACTN|nr:hypothetical protein [Embleya hyalina]GCD99344.1 hypothetical protein EHYA_07059 [Embleya hyalina]